MLLEVKQEKWKSHLIFRYQSKPKKKSYRKHHFNGSWFCYDLPLHGLSKPRAKHFNDKKMKLKRVCQCSNRIVQNIRKGKSRENVLGHFIYCILRDWQGVDLIPCRAGLLHLCLLACGFWGESGSAAVWTYPVFAKGIKMLMRDQRREFLAYALFPELETVTI